MEGGTLYNAINFSYEYNDASGGNFTGSSAAVSVFICPSSTRSAEPGIPPRAILTRRRMNRPRAAATGTWTTPRRSTPTSTSSMACLATGGVGRHDDRPLSQQERWRPRACSRMARPRSAEVTDGLSNTIAIIECAGRDERFVSQYLENLYPVVRGAGARGLCQRCAAPLLAVGRPGLCFRDLGSAQQQGNADQRGRSMAHARSPRPATRRAPTKSLIRFTLAASTLSSVMARSLHQGQH